jgi:hypothetical protein
VTSNGHARNRRRRSTNWPLDWLPERSSSALVLQLPDGPCSSLCLSSLASSPTKENESSWNIRTVSHLRKRPPVSPALRFLLGITDEVSSFALPSTRRLRSAVRRGAAGAERSSDATTAISTRQAAGALRGPIGATVSGSGTDQAMTRAWNEGPCEGCSEVPVQGSYLPSGASK